MIGGLTPARPAAENWAGARLFGTIPRTMPAKAAAVVPRADRYEVVDHYPAHDLGRDLYIADLSKTGARVVSRRLEPVGSQIDVRCTFVEDDLYSIVGIADVVRRDDKAGEMGLRFVWLTGESKAAIEHLEMVRRSRRRRRRVTPR